MSKKIKVKIALAVDANESWNCCGSDDLTDDEKMKWAVDPLDEGEERYWIEVEVEVPDVEVIHAEVNAK